MSSSEIHVADDFSRFPAGRYEGDGPFSGERFRREYLIPALLKGQKTKIFLDGVLGYGSSFLEEAFGGLIRTQNMTAGEFQSKIELISSDASIVKEIAVYVNEAASQGR